MAPSTPPCHAVQPLGIFLAIPLPLAPKRDTLASAEEPAIRFPASLPSLPSIKVNGDLFDLFVTILEGALAVHLFEVAPQARLVGEVHVAVVAAVGLEAAVQVEVVLQRGVLGEALAADGALEGLEAGVHPDVPGQVALLREDLAAAQAQEELVLLDVAHEMPQLLEDAVAARAPVRALQSRRLPPCRPAPWPPVPVSRGWAASVTVQGVAPPRGAGRRDWGRERKASAALLVVQAALEVVACDLHG